MFQHSAEDARSDAFRRHSLVRVAVLSWLTHVDGKCENCMRTGKECHFLKVGEEGSTGRGKEFQEYQRTRTKSLTENPKFSPAPSTAYDTSPYDQGPRSDYFSDELMQPDASRMFANEQYQMQPYSTEYNHPLELLQPPPFPPSERSYQPWPPVNHHEQRPYLMHRQSEPYHRRSEGGYFDTPAMSDYSPLGDPRRSSYFQDHFNTSSWPPPELAQKFGNLSSAPTSSLTSERSSSADGVVLDRSTAAAAADHSRRRSVNPWPPSPEQLARNLQ